MATTYTFTLHAGVTLADSSFTYGGSIYDVKDQLTAGSGSIVTTDGGLAAVLRSLRTPTGLLLDENSVPGAPDPDLRSQFPAYVQGAQPPTPYFWVKTDGAGTLTGVIEVNDGVHGPKSVSTGSGASGGGVLTDRGVYANGATYAVGDVFTFRTVRFAVKTAYTSSTATPDLTKVTALDSYDTSVVPVDGQLLQADSASVGGVKYATNLQIPGPIELVPIYTYGHSYAAGIGATGSGSYVSRLTARTRAASSSNRAVSGYLMRDTLLAAITGAGSWTPGTKGLVVIDSVLNDVCRVPSSGDAINRLGFQEALRSLLRVLRCSAWIDETDASIVYGGSWSSASLGGLRGGTAQTNTSGGTMTITTTARNICLVQLGFDIAAPRTFTYTVNGGSPVTVDCSGRQGYGGFNDFTVPIYGMPAGTNTIVVTNGSQQNWFDGYLVMANPNPPGIVVTKDVPISSAGFNSVTSDTNHTAAVLAIYNGYVSSIVAEAEFADGTIVVADPGPAFDYTTMIGVDTVHPNNIGHAVYADAIQRATSTFTHRNGLETP